MNLSVNKHPSVAVVAPVLNAAGHIHALLSALAAQTVQPEEILIVDDGSTDNTALEVNRFKEAHPELRISMAHQPNQGPATARNYGTSLIRSDLVAFIDSDCAPLADWLEKMIAPFEDPAVAGAQGAYRSSQGEAIAQFIQIEIEDRYEKMKRRPFIDFIGTYSAVFRRQVFQEAGGFDPHFPIASGEDADFSFRLAEMGHRLVFQPEAIVYHTHPNTVYRYLRQKYWRAYWRNLLYRKHMGKMWRDSYTPQTLKAQTLMGALFPVSLVGALLSESLKAGPVLALGMILILGFPFMRTVMRKSWRVGLLAPGLLFLRSQALAFGALHGFLEGAWVRKRG